MNIIKNNCMVEVDFSLKTSRGELIDSSEKDGPLKYIHGQKRINPNLEEQLEGKKVGDHIHFTVKPEDAYGARDESLVQFANKELFGENFDKITIGMPLEVEGPNGEVTVVVAVDIRDDGILLDANHPLAGEILTYDLKVLLVRDATDKELAELDKIDN